MKYFTVPKQKKYFPVKKSKSSWKVKLLIVSHIVIALGSITIGYKIGAKDIEPENSKVIITKADNCINTGGTVICMR